MEIKKIEYQQYNEVINYLWNKEKSKYLFDIEKEKMLFYNINYYDLLDGTKIFFGAFYNNKIVGMLGYKKNKIKFIYADNAIILNNLVLVALKELREEFYLEVLFDNSIETNKIIQPLEITNNKKYPNKYVIRR